MPLEGEAAENSTSFDLVVHGIAVGGGEDLLSLGVFVATGLIISLLNDRLHKTQEALRATAAIANSRAERLDAVLNMTVDGVVARLLGSDPINDLAVLKIDARNLQRTMEIAVGLQHGERAALGVAPAEPGAIVTHYFGELGDRGLDERPTDRGRRDAGFKNHGRQAAP